MSALAEWIVQIGSLVLIAGLVELVVPNCAARGAVRLVVGLVVILSVLEPIIRWVGDPLAVDRLTQAIFVEDAARYVEAGLRMAEEAGMSASAEWERQVERQLGAMAALADGVEEAAVDVKRDVAGGLLSVEVQVWAEEGASRVDLAGVRRLVESFIPGIDPGAIVIMER